MKIIRATSIFFLLLLMTHLGYSRLARENLSLISDGVDNQARQSSIIELNLGESTVTCTPSYSFLPCTTDPLGLLLLILLYEYLLYVGDNYISAGSELFFQTFGPGFFGASLFHILGTIPMVVMTLGFIANLTRYYISTKFDKGNEISEYVLFRSGLSASRESAGEQATMGMSILAGSAVMLLTLIWGLCVAFGCFDLSEASNSTKNEYAKPFSLTVFGVRTDDDTSKTAIVMILSMVPFLILQLAKILNSYLGTRVTILVSLLVTLAFLFAYCIYQVFRPWIQNRRFEYLLSKFVKDKLLVLLTSHGRPNIQFIRQIFCKIDKDGSGKISKEELRVLILGLQLQDDFGLDEGELLQKVIEIFDTSGDDHIDKDEQKTQDAISLSFSEIYSSVFMNNMMSLLTFLALVYIRNLPWDVSAEVLVVLIICTMMVCQTP
ncbi:hypothetical protein F0562_013852 [Nyssa sinensis]|uniref:EF-hand domain-containing protein n=1 Tax=Nyssa sinensis TaxID=561372 RepID=A0A5J4ZLH3_9ASTE|nr:hypothetical protein F0562_013852 [Nyssa sinensis]